MGRMINSRNLSAYLYALMFAVPGAQINQTMTNTLFAPTNSNNNNNKSNPATERERDGDAECWAELYLVIKDMRSICKRKSAHMLPLRPSSTHAATPCPTRPHFPRASEAPPSRGYHLGAKPVRNTAECGTKSVISLSFGYRYSISVRSNVSRSRCEYYTCRYTQHDAIITFNAKIKHQIRIRNKNNNYSTLNGQQVFKRIEHYINSCAFSTISLRTPKWLSVICVLRR